jgi:hypothetical protein
MVARQQYWSCKRGALTCINLVELLLRGESECTSKRSCIAALAIVLVMARRPATRL